MQKPDLTAMSSRRRPCLLAGFCAALVFCLFSLESDREEIREEVGGEQHSPRAFRCAASGPCSARFTIVSASADPFMVVRILDGGNRTIVSPSTAVKSCGKQALRAGRFQLSFCVDFELPRLQGRRKREFLMHVREEYSSHKAALKDYESTCGSLGPSCTWSKYKGPGVSNPVFVGRPIAGSPFLISQQQSPPRGAPAAKSKCLGEELFSGSWQRGGMHGERRDDNDSDELMCPEFYMPDVLHEAFFTCGVPVTVTEAHEPLNLGYTMSTEPPRMGGTEVVSGGAGMPVGKQVDLVLAMDSVGQKVQEYLRGGADTVSQHQRGGVGSRRRKPASVKALRAMVVAEANAILTRRRQQQQQRRRSRQGLFDWQWQWRPNSCTIEPMYRSQFLRCAAAGAGAGAGAVGTTATPHVTFLTDSVGRYTYHYLRCALKQGKSTGPRAATARADAPELVSHVPFKGFGVPSPQFWQRAVATLLKQVDARAATSAGRGQGEVLVVNSGLWDANYGSIDGFHDRIGALLWELSAPRARTPAGGEARRFSRIIWVTTSAVHPLNFKEGLRSMPAKHYLNEPRVEALNDVATAAVTEHNRRARMVGAGGNPIRPQVEVVDNWALSRGREDDPLTPQDMRHFGGSTVHAMAQALLHVLCHGGVGGGGAGAG